jgi:hypothetical protein
MKSFEEFLTEGKKPEIKISNEMKLLAREICKIVSEKTGFTFKVANKGKFKPDDLRIELVKHEVLLEATRLVSHSSTIEKEICIGYYSDRKEAEEIAKKISDIVKNNPVYWPVDIFSESHDESLAATPHHAIVLTGSANVNLHRFFEIASEYIENWNAFVHQNRGSIVSNDIGIV